MAVSVSLQGILTVVETIASNVSDVTSPKLTHDAYNNSVSLNSGTTPTATKVAGGSQALTTGAYTIDFTSMTGPGGASVTFNGLKIRAFMLRNPSTNTGSMTFTKGASNGSTIGTNWKQVLSPGGWALQYLESDGEAIDGTHKTIDVTGTGTESFEFLWVAG